MYCLALYLTHVVIKSQYLICLNSSTPREFLKHLGPFVDDDELFEVPTELLKVVHSMIAPAKTKDGWIFSIP